jgi:hypothetical protein
MLLLAAAPGSSASQVAQVDEGSFTVTRNGREVGRENFSIRSTPSSGGSVLFVAQATAAYGDRRLTPALSADASGHPIRYSVEIRGSSQDRSLNASTQRGRFVTLTRTESGESGSELVITDGAILVDEEIFHHLYFLARSVSGPSATLQVIVPRRGVQEPWRVSAFEGESLRIGGTELNARRLVVTPGRQPQMEVWVQAGTARVLRVAIPSSSIVAQRDDPPR